MTFAVLPVKSPAEAKRRLAGVLSAEERTTLAWMLYRHTLGILLSVERLDRVIVVSCDSGVLDYARQAGAEALAEATPHSHSRSADHAMAQCAEIGAARVLLVPIDVPLLSSADIEQVISTCENAGAPRVAIVPSDDGTGTNALLQSPPAIIPCRFGPGSFEAHHREAALRGVAVTIASPSGLTFDLDLAEDVVAMLAYDSDGDVRRYLGKIHAFERAKEYLSRKHPGAGSRI